MCVHVELYVVRLPSQENMLVVWIVHKKRRGIAPPSNKPLSLLLFLCCLFLGYFLLLLFLRNLLLSFLFCRHSYLLLCDYNHYLIFVKT